MKKSEHFYTNRKNISAKIHLRNPFEILFYFLILRLKFHYNVTLLYKNIFLNLKRWENDR